LQASLKESPAKAEKSAAKGSPAAGAPNQFELRFRDDFAGKGSLHFSGKLEDAADFFKAAAAFGKTLNRGWELTGGTSGFMVRDWDHGVGTGRWSGSLAFAKAQVQVAGLNLPLKLEDARLEWKNGRHNATISRVDAFGAAWSGSIDDAPSASDSTDKLWKFRLHADHLDATDLDLWFGPRARPNWLQRLLPSLLGKPDSEAKPSELLRRISAEGDLTADSLSIEKVKLEHTTAHVAFHDLHLEVRDASAEWAGGTARGIVTAAFPLPPQYEISVDVDRANLSEFPWSPQWDERWSGAASGKLRLTTSGIGREELLDHLAGSGDVHLKMVELRGWDIPASLDSGAVHTGSSRWAGAEGEFTVEERALRFAALTLENPHAKTLLNGNFGFNQELDLTFAVAADEKRGGKSAAAPRTFQLVGPLESPVAQLNVAPVTQAKKQE